MENLANQDWSKVPAAVPVMYIAMVFHNVVPVVTTQLEGEIMRPVFVYYYLMLLDGIILSCLQACSLHVLVDGIAFVVVGCFVDVGCFVGVGAGAGATVFFGDAGDAGVAAANMWRTKSALPERKPRG